MNRIFRYILALFFLNVLFTACHDDMGNYDYQDINEIIVKIPAQVAAVLPETDSILVEITPEITQLQTKGEDNLEFEWRIASQTGAVTWDVYSEEKILQFYVKPETKNTSFRLGVKDVNQGIITYQEVLIKMITPFEDTWFVLQDVSGQAVLGSVDGSGETALVTKDVYDSKYQGAYHLQGVPIALDYCMVKDRTDLVATDWRLGILTDQGGGLYDVKDLKAPVYNYSEMLFELGLAGTQEFKPEYICSNDVGSVIIDDGELWYAYSEGYFVYFPVRPQKSLGGDYKIVCTMPFYAGATLKDYYMAFDDLNKRFLFCRPQSSGGAQGILRDPSVAGDWGFIYSMVLSGSVTLGSVPEDPKYPNAFLPEIGQDKSLLYMGIWNSGNVIAFTKSTTDQALHIYEFSSSAAVYMDDVFCLSQYKFTPSGSMEDICIATSVGYKNIFFYSSGNCVYRVDLNRTIPKASVVYEDPDPSAQIKLMKFKHRYHNTYYDMVNRDQLREQPYSLGVAVQRGAEWGLVELKLGISGEVEKDANKVPKIYKYDGFDKIVDITYTFPMR